MNVFEWAKPVDSHWAMTDNRKEQAMGDKGKRDKERNKKEMIKKREDKAKKASDKNQKKSSNPRPGGRLGL